MSDIQRYLVVMRKDSRKHPDGQYVKYDDHIADKKKALRLQRIELDKEYLADKEKLQARIAELELCMTEWASVCDEFAIGTDESPTKQEWQRIANTFRAQAEKDDE